MSRTTAFLIGGCAGGVVMAIAAIWPNFTVLGALAYIIAFVGFTYYDIHLIKTVGK